MKKFIASVMIAGAATVGAVTTAAVAEAKPVCGSTPESCTGYKPGGLNDYQKKLAAENAADIRKVLKRVHDTHNPGGAQPQSPWG